ncbi:unnamed protein product [Clonostachys rosea f. rosea IK726]|uniref:Uncharacterized protein n=1 Tax=Clonostachys rosea f. rosea IK726 TaxID=1349383 RepID=A0ACA9UK73_BIOOC|nr:unnamed protein product [Clonostachys rosea f. rosea IK726]
MFSGPRTEWYVLHSVIRPHQTIHLLTDPTLKKKFSLESKRNQLVNGEALVQLLRDEIAAFERFKEVSTATGSVP